MGQAESTLFQCADCANVQQEVITPTAANKGGNVKQERQIIYLTMSTNDSFNESRTNTSKSKSCDFFESEEREEAAFTHSDKERYSGDTRDGTLSDKEDNFVENSCNSGSVSSRSLNTNKVEPLPSLTYSSESDPIHSLLDDAVLEENVKDSPRNQVMLLLDNQFTGNNLVPIDVDDLKLEYDDSHGQQLQGNTTELKKHFDEDDIIHSHLESDSVYSFETPADQDKISYATASSYYDKVAYEHSNNMLINLDEIVNNELKEISEELYVMKVDSSESSTEAVLINEEDVTKHNELKEISDGLYVMKVDSSESSTEAVSVNEDDTAKHDPDVKYINKDLNPENPLDSFQDNRCVLENNEELEEELEDVEEVFEQCIKECKPSDDHSQQIIADDNEVDVDEKTTIKTRMDLFQIVDERQYSDDLLLADEVVADPCNIDNDDEAYPDIRIKSSNAKIFDEEIEILDTNKDLSLIEGNTALDSFEEILRSPVPKSQARTWGTSIPSLQALQYSPRRGTLYCGDSSMNSSIKSFDTMNSHPSRWSGQSNTVCMQIYEPNLFSYMKECSRCFSLASEEDQKEFKAKGSVRTIPFTKGGCASICPYADFKSEPEGVRLCRQCFTSLHNNPQVEKRKLDKITNVPTPLTPRKTFSPAKISEMIKPQVMECSEKFQPQIFQKSDSCERCLSLLNKAERVKYEKNHNSPLVTKTCGGCHESCQFFQGVQGSGAVRLCMRCFQSLHKPLSDMVKVKDEGICDRSKADYMLSPKRSSSRGRSFNY